MGILKLARNIVKYRSFSLMPQVDPDVMRPLFEKELGKLSFASPDDHVAVWKTRKQDLRFQYSTGSRSNFYVHGDVFAEEPRASFDDIDVVSFMSIHTFRPDEEGEIFRAIERIVNRADIERVVSGSPFGVREEDALHLQKIRGHRSLESARRYGLGAYTRV